MQAMTPPKNRSNAKPPTPTPMASVLTLSSADDAEAGATVGFADLKSLSVGTGTAPVGEDVLAVELGIEVVGRVELVDDGTELEDGSEVEVEDSTDVELEISVELKLELRIAEDDVEIELGAELTSKLEMKVFKSDGVDTVLDIETENKSDVGMGMSKTSVGVTVTVSIVVMTWSGSHWSVIPGISSKSSGRLTGSLTYTSRTLVVVPTELVRVTMGLPSSVL